VAQVTPANALAKVFIVIRVVFADIVDHVLLIVDQLAFVTRLQQLSPLLLLVEAHINLHEWTRDSFEFPILLWLTSYLC